MPPTPVPRPTSSRARHTDLQRNIVSFCRLLRERDLLVSPSEVIDALRTSEAVDLSDRNEFKVALRSVLTSKPEDVPVYDATFDEFWRSRLPQMVQQPTDEAMPEMVEPNAADDQQQQAESDESEESDTGEEDEQEAPQYSPIEALAGRDFS